MPKTAALLALALFGLQPLLTAQNLACPADEGRISSGPYKGFLQERPPLNVVVLPTLFPVSNVAGTIVVAGGNPLPKAAFELRDANGRILSAHSDDNGEFILKDVAGGSYTFKTTCNGFHSVVGTVVVTRKASSKNKILIQLQPGT
jgi:hypothetical protein